LGRRRGQLCRSFPLAAESISIFAGAFRWRLRASAFLQEPSAVGREHQHFCRSLPLAAEGISIFAGAFRCGPKA